MSTASFAVKKDSLTVPSDWCLARLHEALAYSTYSQLVLFDVNLVVCGKLPFVEMLLRSLIFVKFTQSCSELRRLRQVGWLLKQRPLALVITERGVFFGKLLHE